jgi:uncharacterized protein YxjI
MAPAPNATREEALDMRGRRQERRDERGSFGARGDAVRYQMREKLLSIGDDSWIENADGERVFKVNGKALRVRQTLSFEDLDGNELCKIQERKLRVKDSMEIEGPGGDRLALVKKALVTPLRARFDVQVEDGPDLRVQGNVVDHEYGIESDGTKIAEISKRWFRLRETYGVEIAPGLDEILVLAVAVAVDTMAGRVD